ncbi:type I-G CRISPR-associated helicase/endonuclease Cas3g [Streptomyces qinglanensis]|uniref:type I-G CRISPR-associated helicase/endonuclease Cas3g n=1 Tax=Streptomyces qinglanensis TaxID=943816 RepID=UPI0037AB737A
MAMCDALTAADFPAFYEEVHGYAPFPWQRSLMQRVTGEGWPDLIDVPTGLGKTSVIDVAVFASALGVAAARRRTFLVVDRRLVVDEAYEHAQKLSTALSKGAGPVTRAVAERLRQAGDPGPVLDCTRMRGGVDWSWNWLERPDRHAVVVGTVDQIGSRLFFRGYGVGDQLKPIDAALVGTDSLVVVDEAHLSDPFLQSLRSAVAVERRLGDVMESTGERPVPELVAMSASSSDAQATVHRIGNEDLEHEFARRRLRAHKALHLVEVKATRGNSAQKMAKALAAGARQLAEGIDRRDRVVLTVCNSIARARAVHRELCADGTDLERDGSAALLLIGRNRPLARDYLLDQWYGKIRAGGREQFTGTLHVVATQTVEVGANIDADALVTECASLSALTQRLGRLNRLGERLAAQCLVLHGTGDSDDVYGPARAETWDWLQGQSAPVVTPKPGKQLDLSGPGWNASPHMMSARMHRLTEEDWRELNPVSTCVPRLGEEEMAAWAQTSPRPATADPQIAPFLHGAQQSHNQVTVVWREGLDLDKPSEATAHLAALPPASGETVELPINAARHWLASLCLDPAVSARSDGDVSDLDVGEEAQADSAAQSSNVPVAFRFEYGTDGPVATPITASELRPEDILVVRAEDGGCDEYGWNPESRRHVLDLGDLTGTGTRKRTTVRLGTSFGRALFHHAPELAGAWEQFLKAILPDSDTAVPESGIPVALPGDLSPSLESESVLPHVRVLHTLAKGATLVPYELGDPPDARLEYLLVGSRRALGGDAASASSSTTGSRMSLADHQRAVEHRARNFAVNLDLPDVLLNSVALAALLHDEGKRDDRFQIMLRGGDRWSYPIPGAEPLAKSGMDPTDRAAAARARRRSGYPAGMRHEALSGQVARARLSAGGKDLPIPVDPELVEHLVTTHHGFGRPLLPPITDPDPRNIEETGVNLSSAQTVDLHAPERFRRLNERYGYWGLAQLEALVRLADIWASARNETPETQKEVR